MFFTFLSLFMACEEELTCNTMAYFSVTMELLDEDGSPISDAEISYTVDGVEGQAVENFGSGEYSIGTEESGDFEISIQVTIDDPADGCCVDEGSATISLTIEEDECHVIPQSIAPELEWVQVCDDSEECG